jgi:hypothetical protein
VTTSTSQNPETIDATTVIVDLLQRGHAVQFRARGDSMHPVIRSNDLLHVEPGQNARIGDVVLTLAARGLTAHRLVSSDGTMCVTRGDNAPDDDPPIQLTGVLGRVTRVERAGIAMHVRPESRLFRALRRLRARIRRAQASPA